jgi:hypothetical protein
MALGVGLITSQILGNALKNQGGGSGVTNVTSGGTVGGNFLNSILGQNDSVIPEVQTVQPVNNTGTYIAVSLIVIVALVFIYFTTIKKS